MKRFSLLCLLLLAAAGARAEWFTLRGSAGVPGESYVQVDPTSVEAEGSQRTMAVRLSLAAPRTTRDGIVFRSFTSHVQVDCEARAARYVSATYYGRPDFVGEPIAVRVFEPQDRRPMAFAGAPPDLAVRTVNAACSVRPPRTGGDGAAPAPADAASLPAR